MSINGNANANGGNGWGSLWDTVSKSVGDLISGATDYIYEKKLGHPRGWAPDDRPYYVPAPNTPQNPSGGPPDGYRGMVFSNIPVIYAAGAAVIILVVLLARRK